jgi:hypothetical protein
MRTLTCDEVREMAGAFVLGALDASEDAAVRAHLAAGGHAASHPEIAELGSVIPALFEAVPIVEPPEGLKARIMAAAAADLAARGTAPATPAARAPVAPAAPAPSAPPVTFPGAQERAARRGRTSTGGWLLRIAAVLAIAVLGGWNLVLQNNLGAAQRYQQNVAAVLDTAAKPGAVTAVLTADGGPGSGLAAVDANGDLAMAMRDLTPTSGANVYEAWVIGADGVPVPLGDFKVDSSRTGYFEARGLPSTEGIVLALTLEPGPGATTPTAPIISKGVAAAPG